MLTPSSPGSRPSLPNHLHSPASMNQLRVSPAEENEADKAVISKLKGGTVSRRNLLGSWNRIYAGKESGVVLVTHLRSKRGGEGYLRGTWRVFARHCGIACVALGLSLRGIGKHLHGTRNSSGRAYVALGIPLHSIRVETVQR